MVAGTEDDDDAHAWAAEWLSGVADRSQTMSQRRLSTVERQGGLDAAAIAARARGVHLAVLIDDDGDEIVLASVHPIRIIC